MVNRSTKSRLLGWRNPSIRKSVCLFCSLGCSFAIRFDGEQAKEMDYDKENPINNNGSLCPRGNYNLELLSNPFRLNKPLINGIEDSWQKAVSVISERLNGKDPDSSAIFVSSMLSNEEAFMAAKLANVLGIKRISPFGDKADLEAFEGYRLTPPEVKPAATDDIGGSECLLIIGDLLTRSAVLSTRINKVKYGKRGNKIIVIDPNRTHTSWFATSHIRNKPGTEALLLAAMVKIISEKHKKHSLKIDLDKAAEITGIPLEVITRTANEFDSSVNGHIIFSPSINKQRNDLINYFVRTLVSISPNKKYDTFYAYGNCLGVGTVIDSMAPNRHSYHQIMKDIGNHKIKTLVMLGGNVFPGDPNIEFTVISDHFLDPQISASVVLPLASHLEESGSFMLADGRIEERAAIAVKAGARSNLEWISDVLGLDAAAEADLARSGSLAAIKKGSDRETSLQERIFESFELVPQDEFPLENITHFGNNNLARNFYWYRQNNKEAVV